MRCTIIYSTLALLAIVYMLLDRALDLPSSLAAEVIETVIYIILLAALVIKCKSWAK